MYSKLKQEVYEANMLLPKYELITFTWGNVSQIDRERGVVAIKPSGVEYEQMTVEDIVIVDLQGNVIEGTLNPSSDLQTHLHLYNTWDSIGGITHTHSTHATSWAQSGKDIPAYGTTHGDYFYGDIPCTRDMSEIEIKNEYEYNTGVIITETFENRNISESEVSAVLVNNHGPFTWGSSAKKSVENSVVLEEVSKMALNTELLEESSKAKMSQILLDKHYLRKHGKNAYYGQKK